MQCEAALRTLRQGLADRLQNSSALSTARNGTRPRHLKPPWTESFISRWLLSGFFLLPFFAVILVTVLAILPIRHKPSPWRMTLSRGLGILTSPSDPKTLTTKDTKYHEGSA
jgi:hypothetical protein